MWHIIFYPSIEHNNYLQLIHWLIFKNKTNTFVMKNLIFLLFMIISCGHSYAQTEIQNPAQDKFRLGIKSSIGLISRKPETNILISNNNLAVYEIKSSKMTPQYSYGVFAQKRFGWLYTEGNIQYSTYHSIFEITSFNNSDVPQKEMKENFGYLDFQVNSGIQIEGLRIGVGPIIHVLTNHHSEMSTMENFYDKTRPISFGFSSGFGYDYGIFCFDFKYNKEFRTIGDHMYYGGRKSVFRETPNTFTFSLGILLVK